jgi:hemolysin III
MSVVKPLRRIHCRIKEPFCGLSHWAGVVLSVAALVILLFCAQGRPWHTLSFAIYGASLIILYTASALYHSLHVGEKVLCSLQRLDHSAIFLLIAGTYTPVCLVALRGAWGWGLLAAIYTLALAGIAMSLFWRRAPHWLRVGLCIVMGWLALIALEPLRQVFPPAALGWLIAGGLVYSIGTVFYALDSRRLWPWRLTGHDIWHLFVLGGSACHFIVVFRYVVPVA